nr:MAG TPA: hypothetical protein [Caudoviricetes sp.]
MKDIYTLIWILSFGYLLLDLTIYLAKNNR